MKKTDVAKKVETHLALPYTLILRKDEDGDIVASVEELEGCVADGSDESEAIANLKAMQAAWIEACIESGRSVPLPQPVDEMPSGKWVQRVPRSLHQRLVRLAKREKVSLNALVTTMLSEAAASKTFEQVLLDRTGLSLERKN